MLNSVEHEISTAHKNCNTEKKMKIFSAFKFSDIVFVNFVQTMPLGPNIVPPGSHVLQWILGKHDKNLLV